MRKDAEFSCLDARLREGPRSWQTVGRAEGEGRGAGGARRGGGAGAAREAPRPVRPVPAPPPPRRGPLPAPVPLAPPPAPVRPPPEGSRLGATDPPPLPLHPGPRPARGESHRRVGKPGGPARRGAPVSAPGRPRGSRPGSPPPRVCVARPRRPPPRGGPSAPRKTPAAPRRGPFRGPLAPSRASCGAASPAAEQGQQRRRRGRGRGARRPPPPGRHRASPPAPPLAGDCGRRVPASSKRPRGGIPRRRRGDPCAHVVAGAGGLPHLPAWRPEAHTRVAAARGGRGARRCAPDGRRTRAGAEAGLGVPRRRAARSPRRRPRRQVRRPRARPAQASRGEVAPELFPRRQSGRLRPVPGNRRSPGLRFVRPRGHRNGLPPAPFAAPSGSKVQGDCQGARLLQAGRLPWTSPSLLPGAAGGERPQARGRM